MDATTMHRFDSNDLITEYHTFKQYTSLLFDGPLDKLKTDAKQLTYVLIWVGKVGLKIFNTWPIDNEKKTLEGFWKRLQETIEPKCNFRLARYNLLKIYQHDDENIDTFINRLRIHADKCKFKDSELDDRLIECIIAQGKHAKVREDLLSRDDTLTLDAAIQSTRLYESTQIDLDSFREKKKHIEAVAKHYTRNHHDRTHTPHSRKPSNIPASNMSNAPTCRYCGRKHERGKTKCPAADSTCHACDRKGHWSKVCMAKDKKTYQKGKRYDEVVVEHKYDELRFYGINKEQDEVHTNVYVQGAEIKTSIKVKV